MTAINIWLKDLLPRTSGLLRKVAARECRLAARDFFAHSYAWKEVIEGVATVDGQAQYVPMPADAVNSEVFAIIDVEYGDTPLSRLPQRPIGEVLTGTPAAWYSPVPGQCALWPVPDATATDTLRFTVALIPKADTANLPDFTYQRYYDAILDGALSRIYLHPNRPYTDDKRASYHARRFRQSIAMASAEAKTGTNNSHSWRFPPFA
jgi:hypothetical protein